MVPQRVREPHRQRGVGSKVQGRFGSGNSTTRRQFTIGARSVCYQVGGPSRARGDHRSGVLRRCYSRHAPSPSRRHSTLRQHHEPLQRRPLRQHFHSRVRRPRTRRPGTVLGFSPRGNAVEGVTRWLRSGRTLRSRLLPRRDIPFGTQHRFDRTSHQRREPDHRRGNPRPERFRGYLLPDRGDDRSFESLRAR
jgi:hypothetical protein